MSYSNTEFVADMHALSVSGVNRSYNHLPASVADLPVKALDFPTAERDELYASNVMDLGKRRVLEVIVLIAPDGQSTPSVKQAATVTMMDALETALDGYYSSGTTPRINYEIRAEGRVVGETSYYAAVARVTARVTN